MSVDLKNVRTWLKSLLDDDYQATLVSGTNIKTINNNSILGSGNITIGGGGGGGISIDDVYPIGSIYMSVNSTNPSVLFGGTWEQIEDRFLLASGSTYTNGDTGGSADAIVVEHTHTQNAHNHKPFDSTSFVETNATALATGSTKRVATSNTNGNFYWQSNQSSEPTIARHTVTANATATNNSTGESGTGKNMPPYLVVYVWKRVADITYDSVALTTNKSILSQADSETLTLSAQLMNGQSSDTSSGVTVEFFKGSTSLGTATTNSSGVATKTYTSTGAGDLSFTAKVGNLVSETYSIEDCYYWNEQGVTYTSNSSTDRKVLTGLEDIVSFTPNGAFEFSFTLEDSTGSSKRLYLISKPQSTSTTNNYGIGANIGASNNHMIVRTTSTTITETAGKTNPADFKFIRNGTTLQMYHNDTLVTTKTVNWFDTYAPYTISWAIWSTGTITATNIKIKPL